MTNFDNKMIQEAAYYIWKNNGCPNNSSASDWQAAIDQLERQDALATASAIYKQYCRSALVSDNSLVIKTNTSAKAPTAVVKKFSTNKNVKAKKQTACAAKLSTAAKKTSKVAANKKSATKRKSSAKDIDALLNKFIKGMNL